MTRIKHTIFFAICSLLILSSCGSDETVSVEEDFTAFLAAGNTTISETAMSNFTIALSETNASGNGVTVSYSVSGTATSGDDFQPLNGSVTIANGSLEEVVNLVAIDDSDIEESETIIITINSSEKITVGTPGTVTFTITDNDTVVECPNDNTTNQNNTQCTETPDVANSYDESVSGDERTITTNRVPDHDYGNQVANMGISGLVSTTETFRLDATPELATTSTSIVDDEFKPAYDMGIALNGVPIDPAPGEPFIFEDTNTGEYNWDWVFEPNNNRSDVGLDCNTAHLQPDMASGKGLIHYHGDMAVYADDLLAGLGTGSTVPTEAVQIGWGADGFPIVYKYGPDADGTFKKLTPGYVLKEGDRSGDGVTEPCGEYSGKYTNDYEYSATAGDLDECNGIEQSITINGETFSYYYVITDDFPVIPRCISGTPGNDFRKGM